LGNLRYGLRQTEAKHTATNCRPGPLTGRGLANGRTNFKNTLLAWAEFARLHSDSTCLFLLYVDVPAVDDRTAIVMSNLPEFELDLDLQLLPAWAKQSPDANPYAKHSGEDRSPRREDRPGRRDDRGRRPPPRRDAPQQRGHDQRRPQTGGRPESGRPEGGRPRFDRGRPQERREPPPPLPQLEVMLLPDEKGVDSLARQIRMTGRAYPLFDIAHMILQKPERQQVRFSVKKNAEGKVIQPLFLCALDDTLWLSEDEAVHHVLSKHFDTFYQTERIATDPPKGIYTFVAQCGMSGVILGPPNYHDYQNQLRKLHGERFSQLPFDAFKARVKIVKDEAVVKKWVEDQSWKTEFVVLNEPEANRLGSREAVERHFREVHLPNIIKEVESHTLSGPASRELVSPALQRLLRHAWEEQKRFPLKVVTVLSQQFAARGLQFFKVNKTITHVGVARPHFLDLEVTPVSEGVKRIVDFIGAHPKCTRRSLLDALAPASAPTTGTDAPGAEEKKDEPTPEQTALISDLHWLIHQGHVIEFSNGVLETAKKPIVRPPKAEKRAPSENDPVPGSAGGAVPDASVEEIAPEVSVMESGQPVGTLADATPSQEATPPSEPAPPVESGSATEKSPSPQGTQETETPEVPAPAEPGKAEGGTAATEPVRPGESPTETR
jgi:hypothetical protein